MKKLISIFIILVAVATLFGITAVGKKLPSVGYVLVGPKNDGGWSMRHYHGFMSLKKHGYNVAGVENLPENMILYLLPHSVIWMEW
jgi:basic membrane lipoprotein Med (substrate-binding protein (PBP1-ABC) superfamily)